MRWNIVQLVQEDEWAEAVATIKLSLGGAKHREFVGPVRLERFDSTVLFRLVVLDEDDCPTTTICLPVHALWNLSQRKRLRGNVRRAILIECGFPPSKGFDQMTLLIPLEAHAEFFADAFLFAEQTVHHGLAASTS